VGAQVHRFREGDHAYAVALINPKGGFYAEYAVVKADNVSPIPKKLSVEQAGVMPSDALTALRGLDEILKLKKGESLMVFGAGGGIGHLAVQLAKRIGARVFAVASGDDGVALAKRLGADAVANGRKDDIEAAARAFAPGGLDAALVTAGGESTDRALRGMKKDGRVAYPNGVMPAPKAPSGAKIQSYDIEPTPQQIERLNRLIESGPFEVHVARTFPLDKAADAHRELDKHYLGKLALRPQ
jgi:NADPH:quinone reductase-like Zn-dependent oxidoreductase